MAATGTSASAAAPKAAPTTRQLAYSVSLPDGTQESREVSILISEGVLISALEDTRIDSAGLVDSLAYLAANPPVFAIGDSAVKIPGWRSRARDEPLTLAESTIGLTAESPTGLVLTSSVDQVPEVSTVFPGAASATPAKSAAGLLVLVGALLIVYAASATTSTAAHTVFREDAATLLGGASGTPAYNVVLALLSHTFAVDIRRGAGSARIWTIAGAIYGGALGLGHLIVSGKVDMSGVTQQQKNSIMSIFCSLTKRSICELGSCCRDILDYVEAIESPGMQKLVGSLVDLKSGNLCVVGDPAYTALKECNVDAESFRREIFALRGLLKASNPDKILELRGSKVAHLLKNPAVSAVVNQNRKTSARFQGITAVKRPAGGGRSRGRAEA